MKGLTLTMEIVIIAIVLLVTALVIMTIFGGSIASFLGILNPWSQSLMEQNLCNQRCAAYCQGHLGTADVGWSELKVQTQSGTQDCSTIMQGLTEGDKCSCRTIISNACKMQCTASGTSSELTGNAGENGCSTGKRCKVTCPVSTSTSEIPGTCI
jgi:hypothetical protein